MAKIRDLTYIAFDLEATCHPSLRYHEIIEIGAVRLNPVNLEVVDLFGKLVCPSTPIIKPIIEKTGITDEMVIGEPSIRDIWNEFVSFIGDAILVAHQAPLDVGILRRTAERDKLELLENPALDTIRLARRLYPKETSYGLEHLQKLIEVKITAHRAKADAYVTGKLFRHFVNILEEKFGLSEYDQLWEFCYGKNPGQMKMF